MPYKTSWGNRTVVRCRDCEWRGHRVEPATSKPCPKCGGTHIKRIDIAQEIDRRFK